MSENVEKQDGQNGSKLNRRNFIGALGAAAAAGALLETMGGGVKAQNPQTVWYQDSFGDIVPAGAGTLALGIQPPPLLPGAVIPGQQNSQPQATQHPTSHKGPHGPGGRLNPESVEGAHHGPGRTRPQVCETNQTYYSAGFPKYNILLIMVDQMRNPNFWPPTSGSILGSSGPIPNISNLMGTSFTFPNYFVNATVCGPSRACLQTGLYTQQNGIFRSLPIGPGQAFTPPPLLPWYGPGWTSANPPGFPTIGNVLSQSLPVGCDGGGPAQYNCTWIGKWHLSCSTAQGYTMDGPGYNGPYDYGYRGSIGIYNYNIPTFSGSNPYPRGNPGVNKGYPSPDGLSQEGNSGEFLDSQIQQPPPVIYDVPNYSTSTPLAPIPGVPEINDAAIADAFGKWLAAMNGQPDPPPWFCAVSFINPHDISDFPYTFGLVPANTPNCPTFMNMAPYCTPSMPYMNFFQPPPAVTAPMSFYGNNCLGGNNPTSCTADGDVTTIEAVPTSYNSLPSGWNWEDQSGTPYSSTGPNFKPGLQQYFQTQRDSAGGGIANPYSASGTPTGWETFLNYYLWLESCVDVQIGNVLGYTGTGKGLFNSNFWNNTVIIFTADHGDYAGSHGIHSKGGALYEEVINVPLFISFPECRGNWPNPPTAGAPPALPYVCSAVDMLPFLYTLALGNDTWRVNPNDIVYYLRGREAIMDAIMQATPASTQPIQERRISGIRLAFPFGTQTWQIYQPFVLHTADDISIAKENTGAYHPSHAIAFRTVDQTDPITNPPPANGATQYGGGKLGVYCYWDTCDPPTPPSPQFGYLSSTSGTTPPDSEFEFYNYSPNPQGNDPTKPGVNVSEVGNTYFTSNAPGNEGSLYVNDFFGARQNQLYYNSDIANNPQVAAAVQAALNNYLLYLSCSGQHTSSNGLPVGMSCSPTTCQNCTGNCSGPSGYEGGP